MNKNWLHGVIKYFHKRGLAPRNIHADMVAILRASAPSNANVKRWAPHSKMGKESLKDDDGCGRPTTATTKGSITHLNRVVWITGPGCSKLTMSLVNVSLKVRKLISEMCQYFLLKKCEKLLHCKSFSYFVNKKYQCIWL